jgi:aspartokinase/homoserine dehydrogenase 1
MLKRIHLIPALFSLLFLVPACEPGEEPAGVPASIEPRSTELGAEGGSIFVDVTDSEDIWREYEGLLREGINIVSSNRRALAVPFVEYAAMHAAAQENGVFLRYETTVGSALPAVESIAAGANTGDELISIEAVVSCTLNRILSEYTLTPCTFAQIVRKAQAEGLTEPDPRVDLSGREALRKLLILAREAGVPLEEEDVEIEPVIGPEYAGLTLEEFYSKLEADEPKFAALESAADAAHQRQRFVASLTRDPSGPHGYKAAIRVQNVDASHPAYRIKGTENAIIVRSAYHPYPLLIQGAGEGAILAASSVLNDILK